MHCAGPRVRPGTYCNIIQIDVLTGLPNAGPFVYERSGTYSKITYRFVMNFVPAQQNYAYAKVNK